MTKTDLYLTALSNCLVLLGSVFEKFFTQNAFAQYVGYILIISGYVVACISDVYIIAKTKLSLEDVSTRSKNINYYFLIANIFSVFELYLPYFGHALMALGYILEQLQSVGPPLPSAIVLIGHLCVLTDPKTLSSERPTVQIINIVFLFSNIFMFLYDLVRAFNNVPRINEVDQYTA